MWFRPVQRDAQIRLICLPYAGGGANEFRRWSEHLPSAVEVCPVLLPGREVRARERARHDLNQLAEDIADALAILPGKLAFYGHSMGACLAWRIAVALRDRGQPAPLHLFLGARRPPHMAVESAMYALPEPEFLELLQARYGAIPPELLEMPGLLRMFLPTLRADLEAVETWVPPEEPPLSCPITVFAGTEDRRVPPGSMQGWRDYTSKRFSERSVVGGHFFLKGPNPELLKSLSNTLEGLL